LNILFVYNKKAGKKFEPSIVNEITALIPKTIRFSFVDIREMDTYDVTIFDTLVAIGGDGTVNTVAKIASKNNKTLGLIPKGSGDGLARFLTIPRDTKMAVRALLNGKTIAIDTARVDDVFFINVAGAGFEAEVAHKFGAEGVRGLKGYAKTILESFSGREEKKVTLTLDGKKTTLPFFSLSIANGAQWGNNFEIASNADIQDGLLDVAIMRKPKWHQILGLVSFLKSKKQVNNALFTYYKASEINVKRSGKLWHIDGEPIILKNKKRVVIYQKNLRTIVPK
jgi:YegS/Rv2252/BmrU family lipid kinase|tara:strand:+ start:11194 stop:12039 length:846 start_codon:yes stop_codon:yes gene_type:complete